MPFRVTNKSSASNSQPLGLIKNVTAPGSHSPLHQAYNLVIKTSEPVREFFHRFAD
ncbi:hypothetical protein CDEST_08066 [Colletotrichum destructivum]|uniref:Uncharacterized protein n=1 Tax=Colletotrichum destructivum TaxID=34406 RepID=A0AAX4II10_9PEZI|nr:hypothetical protein CDEST_08066 [Colletotrichum destructivum]